MYMSPLSNLRIAGGDFYGDCMLDIEIKVEDHPNLVRRRGAIVNKDIEGYQRFMSARQAIQERDSKINGLEARMARMEALLEQVVKNEP